LVLPVGKTRLRNLWSSRQGLFVEVSSIQLPNQQNSKEKQAVDYAREIEIEAQRKLGEFLKDMEKNKGALKIGPVVRANDHGTKLADIGISKNLSSEAQALAELPEKELRNIVKRAEGLAIGERDVGRSSHVRAR